MVTLPDNRSVSRTRLKEGGGLIMDMSSTTDKHHLRRRLCWDAASQSEPPSLNHRQDLNLNRSRSQPQDRRVP